MSDNTPAAVLPQEGFVRLKNIIGPGNPIPVGKTAWWVGVGEGRYPQPVKLSPGVTAWRVEAIRELIENPPQTGDQSRVEAKDDEAAQSEAKRHMEDEDEEADADALEAA